MVYFADLGNWVEKKENVAAPGFLVILTSAEGRLCTFQVESLESNAANVCLYYY
jgi:hypothetical protein